MNRAILSVYYGLGLRRSEGIALDIDDIQVSNGVVYIRKGKNSKERYVPMNDSVQKDIGKYISQVRKILLNGTNHKEVKELQVMQYMKDCSTLPVLRILVFLFPYIL